MYTQTRSTELSAMFHQGYQLLAPLRNVGHRRSFVKGTTPSLPVHTGPEQGRKMKETDAQVSQCHFFRVIEPDKTQKKVKKVSEPIFHNELCCS